MLNNLALKLWERDSFKAEYHECLIFSAMQQLNHRLVSQKVSKVNWKYLLEAATILIHSDESHSLEAAVRISYTCIENPECTRKQKSIAAWILEQLRNNVGVELAIEKALLEESYSNERPNLLNIYSFANRASSLVAIDNNDALYLSEFQLELWDSLNSKQYVSASASTAAGKSYATLMWICNALRQNSINELVYIAPTRALVSEIETKLKKHCKKYSIDVHISSVPWLFDGVRKKKNIYVLTQERFHILLNRSNQTISPDFLVVDEAHKIDEEVRGIILETVIQQSLEQYPNLKIAFISPSTINPEILIKNFSPQLSRELKSSIPTVNQNLFWINKRNKKTKIWDVEVVSDENTYELGHIELSFSPGNLARKKLAFISEMIGRSSNGNVIYTNFASEAEEVAVLLEQILPEPEDIKHLSEIDALGKLITHTVHKDFLLHRAVKKRIAFHYGNMPELLRREIERLFSEGVIQYLICTSTLMEGVNLSCKNIFIRGAKKGMGRPMRQEDFWNLAGRAGRWGKEFAGNIFCIDPREESLWEKGHAPKSKEGIQINRSTVQYMNSLPTDLNSIDVTEEDDIRDASLSLLTRNALIYPDLSGLVVLQNLPQAKKSELIKLSRQVIDLYADVPDLANVVQSNPHINPMCIVGLYNFFCDNIETLEEFLPIDPSDNDAVEAYKNIFKNCAKYLGAKKLARNENLALKNAIIVTRWMCGWPIPRIIDSSLTYWQRRDPKKTSATIIRDVLNDIENIARFHAPNYLSCYVDILNFVIETKHVKLDVSELDRFSVMLEYGVSTQTQLSLISLGLSRNTAILLYEIIAKDDLTPQEALDFIKNFDVQNLDIPNLIKEEISTIISSNQAISI